MDLGIITGICISVQSSGVSVANCAAFGRLIIPTVRRTATVIPAVTKQVRSVLLLSLNNYSIASSLFSLPEGRPKTEKHPFAKMLGLNVVMKVKHLAWSLNSSEKVVCLY